WWREGYNDMKATFIGGGTMAEAIIKRLVAEGVVLCDDIAVVDPSDARRELLLERYGVSVSETPEGCLTGADVIVLAVKPQEMEKAAAQVGALEQGQLLLSILAGVRTDRIVSSFNHRLVVRAMPNTPAQIGSGMTVWTAAPEASEEQLAMVRTILAALGTEQFVPEEKYVDMATALSGSGPAYVFLFIEALVDGAVRIGMPRPMAEKLAVQTVLGSAEFLEQSGEHPAELRNRVTSPGGTTAAALHELEKGSLRSLLADAIASAYAKAKNL
ncbi:pyrroline-5-carboxylate reductase, partial [Chloroflexota bacterium]